MEKVLKLEVKNNIPEFKKFLSGKVRKQIPFASAMAINQTLGIGRGFKDKGLDREMAKQMEAKLDNPRPQTKKAFFRRFANKKTLTGVLGFVEWANEFMQYQVFGGSEQQVKIYLYHLRRTLGSISLATFQANAKD